GGRLCRGDVKQSVAAIHPLPGGDGCGGVGGVVAEPGLALLKGGVEHQIPTLDHLRRVRLVAIEREVRRGRGLNTGDAVEDGDPGPVRRARIVRVIPDREADISPIRQGASLGPEGVRLPWLDDDRARVYPADRHIERDLGREGDIPGVFDWDREAVRKARLHLDPVPTVRVRHRVRRPQGGRVADEDLEPLVSLSDTRVPGIRRQRRPILGQFRAEPQVAVQGVRKLSHYATSSTIVRVIAERFVISAVSFRVVVNTYEPITVGRMYDRSAISAPSDCFSVSVRRIAGDGFDATPRTVSVTAAPP